MLCVEAGEEMAATEAVGVEASVSGVAMVVVVVAGVIFMVSSSALNRKRSFLSSGTDPCTAQ